MKIKFDQIKVLAAGATFEAYSGGVRVVLPGGPGGVYFTMDGDDIVLLPERSSSHRQMVAILTGEVPPDPSEDGDYTPSNYGG